MEKKIGDTPWPRQLRGHDRSPKAQILTKLSFGPLDIGQYFTF